MNLLITGANGFIGRALSSRLLSDAARLPAGVGPIGRLTLMDLIRRLRYSGYLDQIEILEREPGEVFEKLIDHLASTHEWSSVSIAARRNVSTGSGSDRVAATNKATTKKAAKKSSKIRKVKAAQPEPDALSSEPVKLHYLVDRRDFLDKVKKVYAAYAG